MQTAVKTSVAPRSSRPPRRIRAPILPPSRRIECTYELGLVSWRTLVEEMVFGVTMPRPGSSGKSGAEA